MVHTTRRIVGRERAIENTDDEGQCQTDPVAPPAVPATRFLGHQRIMPGVERRRRPAQDRHLPAAPANRRCSANTRPLLSNADCQQRAVDRLVAGSAGGFTGHCPHRQPGAGSVGPEAVDLPQDPLLAHRLRRLQRLREEADPQLLDHPADGLGVLVGGRSAEGRRAARRSGVPGAAPGAVVAVPVRPPVGQLVEATLDAPAGSGARRRGGRRRWRRRSRGGRGGASWPVDVVERRRAATAAAGSARRRSMPSARPGSPATTVTTLTTAAVRPCGHPGAQRRRRPPRPRRGRRSRPSSCVDGAATQSSNRSATVA